MRKPISFTNKLSVFIIGLLTAYILMSFILSIYSIRNQYMGALACWTVCTTPLGAGLSIVLNSAVRKSQAENTGPNGEGIKYELAMRETEAPTI